MRRILPAAWMLATSTLCATAENWPQFRGPDRNNISTETGLLRAWPESGPKVLWTTSVCQGYAAAAIYKDRVYFNDYNAETYEWSVRCLTLADGQELWRYTDKKRIRPNHGITRTVPAVDDKYVFSLDPKCVFHCLDAKTGKELWRKKLAGRNSDYDAQIPPWYNGQCPLLEEDRVIIAPGGDALMVALRKDTGAEVWRTPNKEGWPLAHSSVMPATLGGVKQYLWCTLFGPLGVAADDGRLLWHHDRKFNVAVAPSPLPIGDDRVFMTSGYDAGSIMLHIHNDNGTFRTEVVFDWDATGWNSEVHTPVLFEDHMFAVGKEKRGLFTCLDLDGNVVWDSRGQASFGLGSFLLADGMFFILEGRTGKLRLIEASTSGYEELASAQVLHGHDVWAPMALSDGKLVIRDMRKMVCLQVADEKTARTEQNGPLLAFSGSSLPVWMYNEPASPSEPARMTFRLTQTISGKDDTPESFRQTLRGIAVDDDGRLYAVGDDAVKCFDADGTFVREWQTARPGFCIAVDDGRVFVGQAQQIEIFDRLGKPLDVWRDKQRLGLVTSIGFTDDQVVVADTQDRCLRVFTEEGRFVRTIGKPKRGRGFLLPNRHLDFAVDGAGLIHAVNPGKHRVVTFDINGEQRGHWGRFGTDPAGFPGCCNPTNIALCPNGNIVVSEKAPARVKLYTRDGKLRAVIAERHFAPAAANVDLAVDANGRIYAADTERLQIRVFAPVSATQPTEPREKVLVP